MYTIYLQNIWSIFRFVKVYSSQPLLLSIECDEEYGNKLERLFQQKGMISRYRVSVERIGLYSENKRNSSPFTFHL